MSDSLILICIAAFYFLSFFAEKSYRPSSKENPTIMLWATRLVAIGVVTDLFISDLLSRFLRIDQIRNASAFEISVMLAYLALKMILALALFQLAQRWAKIAQAS